MISTAESPSDASRIAATWESWRNRSMILCLAGVSSSATITQRPSGADSGMGILSGPSQRQRYFNFGSTTGAPFYGEKRFSLGRKPGHTLPRHGKPHAAGVLKRPTRRKPYAVVEHTNIKPVPVPLRRHDH